MTNDAEVSSEELGRWLGISGRAVRDLALRCVFEKTKRGRYLLASSVTRYCDHLRKLATGRGGETSIATATAQRARLIAAQADPVEAKNARERDALLDSAAVEKTWSDIVRQSRCSRRAIAAVTALYRITVGRSYVFFRRGGREADSIKFHDRCAPSARPPSRSRQNLLVRAAAIGR
jgi:hypothetical protein